MISTSTAAADAVKFTPSWLEKVTPKPVFYLRAGGPIERGMMEADLSGEHMAAEIGGKEVRQAVLDGVERLFSGDPEYDRVVSTVTAEAEEVAAFSKGDREFSDQVHKLLAEHWPAYRELLSRRARRQQIAPILALQRFCVGWEHVKSEKGEPVVFARDARGFVTEAAIGALERYEMLAAGNRAYSMQYGGGEEKNSVQPSASDEGQKTSQEG